MELRFRRWILCLGLLSVLIPLGGGLFAQDASSVNQNTGADKNATIIRTYNIRKIYAHRLGYRIDVWNYQGKIRTVYAKVSWFADPDQRNPEKEAFEMAASMVFIPSSYKSANKFPSNYMTLRYQAGKLVSMSIYIDEPSYAKDTIWSYVPPTENIDGKFDIKTVVFSNPPAIPAGSIPIVKDTETES